MLFYLTINKSINKIYIVINLDTKKLYVKLRLDFFYYKHTIYELRSCNHVL